MDEDLYLQAKGPDGHASSEVEIFYSVNPELDNVNYRVLPVYPSDTMIHQENQ